MIIILQLLDIISTYLVLKDGKGYEANKLIAIIINKLGIVKGLILVKLIISIPLWYLATHPSPQWLLNILIVIYVITVINNFNEYRKQV